MSVERQPTPCLFGPFRFDGENAQLRRGNQPVALAPKALKTFAVLRYLVRPSARCRSLPLGRRRLAWGRQILDRRSPSYWLRKELHEL